MDLRPFGKLCGFDIPRANIGAMRLPRDVDDAIALIRHAIDSGMRYIDTSRGYGESEWILGRALKDGYREKVILSTKWSPWITKIRPDDDASADRVRRRIEESMRRLDVDYLDFYQVWNIDNRENYDKVVAKGGQLEGILKAKDEGLIRHTGFTTHDSVENLLDYLDECDWCEILLTSYNLIDQRYAPVIAAAHEKGIGTVVMNPVGGGRLAADSPVLLDLAERVGAESVADLAIRFVMSNPCIDTIISGISKTSDVDDTIASTEAGSLSAAQLDEINTFLETVNTEKSGFCTSCKYCMPCPQGIDIPHIMNCNFDARVWGFQDAAKKRYNNIKTAKADACVECGVCEEKCTQKLGIIKEMSYAATELAAAEKN